MEINSFKMLWRSDDLEMIRCDFCGSEAHDDLFVRPDGMRMVVCTKCGLCFLNPRPKEEQIIQFYDINYFKRTRRTFGIEGPRFHDRLRLTAQKKMDMISYEYNLNGKKILEVGCATGEFCYLAQRKGAKVSGIDISSDIIDIAKRRYKDINFREGTIEDIPSGEIYDAIFAFEVIEHVISPKRFFESVKSHLTSDGMFILSTPNLSCGVSVGLEKWAGSNYYFDHLYFFTIETITKYAMEMKMSVQNWYTGDGKGIYKKSLRRDLKNFMQLIMHKLRVLNYLYEIKAIYDRSINKNRPPGYISKGNSHNLLVFIKNK